MSERFDQFIFARDFMHSHMPTTLGKALSTTWSSWLHSCSGRSAVAPLPELQQHRVLTAKDMVVAAQQVRCGCQKAHCAGRNPTKYQSSAPTFSLLSQLQMAIDYWKTTYPAEPLPMVFDIGGGGANVSNAVGGDGFRHLADVLLLNKNNVHLR